MKGLTMAEQTPLRDVTAAAGATFVEEAGWLVPARFDDLLQEYQRARTGSILFDLSHRGKLEVDGPDARSFLHNLSSNDIRNLAAGSECEAFLTTATAKVVAYLRVACLSSDARRAVFQLDLAPGTLDRVRSHLEHYRISEQVEFTDRTRELALVHLAGSHGVDVIKALPASSPAMIRRLDRLGLPGLDVLCAADLAPGLWQVLVAAGAAPAGRDTFEVLRVEAGMPAQGLDIEETTFVPEVGRNTQAISYTKGCYLGQEPIVMARDRGHVNRQLLGLKLSGDPAPQGSLVFRDDKEVGRVTSSVRSPRLGAIALAYLRRGNQEPGTSVEVEVPGQHLAAEVARLPF
jgi:tRNA-modifying protein YgfZ